jgi:GNAT superfamily N-acetyltransferase
MTLAFVQAMPTQEAAVRAVMRAAFAPYMRRLGREIAPTSFAGLADALSRGDVWLAQDGEAILGVAEIKRDGDTLVLEHLAVAPDRQNAGIGSFLLREVERRARDGKVAAMALYTAAMMEDLLRLYARYGFVEISRGPPPHGKDTLPRVFLRKELP